MDSYGSLYPAAVVQMLVSCLIAHLSLISVPASDGPRGGGKFKLGAVEPANRRQAKTNPLVAILSSRLAPPPRIVGLAVELSPQPSTCNARRGTVVALGTHSLPLPEAPNLAAFGRIRNCFRPPSLIIVSHMLG